MKCFVVLAALMFSLSAWGEMRSIRLNARVKSFDEQFVTIQLHKRTVRIPRDLVGKTELKAGAMVSFTFRGDQINYLFAKEPGDVKNTRSPASTSGK